MRLLVVEPVGLSADAVAVGDVQSHSSHLSDSSGGGDCDPFAVAA